MRTLIAAVALAASLAGPCLAQASAPSAPAEIDPANLALAREVIDLSYPPAMRRGMFSRATDTMMEQARRAVQEAAGSDVDLDPGLERILDRYAARARAAGDRAVVDGMPTIFAAFARAYARQFTHEELVQIRAFVATPTGAKYVQQSAELLSDPDVARANTAYMASVFAELGPLQEELRREVTDYLRNRRQSPSSRPPAVG